MTNPYGFRFSNPLVDEDDDEGPENATPPPANSSQTVERTGEDGGETPASAQDSSQTVVSRPIAHPFLDDDDDTEDHLEVPLFRLTRPVAPTVRPAQSPALAVAPTALATAEATECAPGSGRRSKKVYNRKLLNKHDDAVLGFLAAMKVANTRILGLATGKTDRQVQQRLKGLQELGLTDNRLLPGTQAIWVVTPKGVRTLRKRGLLDERPYLTGTRLDLLKNSSLGHKLAEATVAAHFMNGYKADLLGPLTWQNLIHENEISAGFSRARNQLDYRSDVRASDVRRKLLAIGLDEEWEGIREARLYLARRGITKESDPTKIPDLVVVGNVCMAVEVELYSKSFQDYLQIMETYRQSEWTYGRVLYVVREKGTALLLMRAAAEVHGVARRDRINSPDMWLNAPRDSSATAEMLAEQRRIADEFAKLDGRLMVEALHDSNGDVFSGDPWHL